MAVIWGLDLAEIKWSKFKSSYMWNNEYHLRRTRFIVYQLAMILCVVSESLGTDALSNYVDEQKQVEHSSRGNFASVKNDDIVGAFSYNIFVGVFVATIFGAAFFFDLFWPERHESKAVRIAWKACSVLACCFALSSAIVLTVILATKNAILTGPLSNGETKLDPPLEYKKNGEAIASVVLIWLGWLATIWSAYLMFVSIDHNEQYGPKSTHARNRTSSKIDGGENGLAPSTEMSQPHNHSHAAEEVKDHHTGPYQPTDTATTPVPNQYTIPAERSVNGHNHANADLPR